MLTPFTRKLKKTNILLGWLLFFLAIAAIIWFFISVPEATEEIKSLKISEVKADLIEKERGWEPPFTYIISAKILNPNQNFTVPKMDYFFEIKDDQQNIISQIKNQTSINEDEEKEIKEKIVLEKSGKTLRFKIENIEWRRAED